MTKEVDHAVNRVMSATPSYFGGLTVANTLSVIESRAIREERWFQSSEMGWRREGHEVCVGAPACLCRRCLDYLYADLNP